MRRFTPIRGQPAFALAALGLVMRWTLKHDARHSLPYRDDLSALMDEPSFHQTADELVFSKARVINALGNRALAEEGRV